MKKKLKHILILATGGTIAGSGPEGNTTGYQAGVISIDEILADIPNLKETARISAIQISNLNSDDITFNEWKKLVDAIHEHNDDPDIDGFVITHGTDTLEETAMFLNLTLKTTKPVILTGSMKPATAISADGPLNLYDSVVVATHEDAINKGVLVVFDNAIYCARDVKKISTFQTDAFGSGKFGAIEFIRDHKVDFYLMTTKPHTIHSDFDITGLDRLPSVGMAYFTIDSDPSILPYLASQHDGLVIVTAGDGQLSKRWLDAIDVLLAQEYPLILSTRVFTGNISAQNNANTFNPQKSRILLQLALTKTKDQKIINRYFSTY